jgi:protein associated with RNAse G/E
MWAAGTTIVHQELWRDRVWAARPLVVIEDADDRLLLWLPKGTVRKVVTPPGRFDPPSRKDRVIENLERCDWAYGEHTWDVSSLWILRPGDYHAVWVSWLGSGAHLGWYVNLQRPYRRAADGIEAMDLMLDVVVEPDLTWRWKDHDKFDEIVERGILDRVTEALVRKESAAMIRRIEARQQPFCDPWPSWRPDPRWGIPALPDDWDQPRDLIDERLTREPKRGRG